MNKSILKVVMLWFAIVAISPFSLQAADPVVADEEKVKALIRELGDRNFKVRDNALRRLTELEPIEALRKALKSDDPEIARLAARILDDLDKAAIVRSL